MSWLRWFLDDSDFMPRWMCGGWSDGLVNLNIAANAIIAASYLAIFIQFALLWAAVRDRVRMTWIILSIGLFVLACGFTHVADVVVFWRAPYRLFTAVDVATATLSAFTAIMVPGVVRYLVALPSAQLTLDLNRQLESSVRDARQQAADRETLRLDADNTNRFLRSKLAILEGRLIGETDHAARMLDIQDVRSMLVALDPVISGEGCHDREIE